MNNNDQKIETLKILWQQQKPGESKMNNSLATDSFIIKRLKKYESFQLRINLLKTIILILIAGSFTWYLFKYADPSLMLIVSLVWIAACLVIFMTYYWRSQFQSAQLDFTLQTKDFIDSAIKKLNGQRKIFRTWFPLMVFGLMIGLNLMYFDLLSDMDTGDRLLFHLIGSVFLAVFVPLGLKIRSWKFRKEQQPVIDDLLNFKTEIKE